MRKYLYHLIVVFLCADCLEYIFSYFISTLHRAQAIEATQGNLRFLVRDGDSQSGGRSSLIEAWALIILQSSKWNHFDIVCPLIKGISVSQYVVGNFVGVRSNWWNRWEVENLFGARRRSEEVAAGGNRIFRSLNYSSFSPSTTTKQSRIKDHRL